MIIDENALPTLYQFFGNYCNQDYDIEYGNFDTAVASYMRESSDSDKENLARDILFLLSRGYSENELSIAMNALQNSIDPVRLGSTPSKWLASICDKISCK